MPAYHSQFNDNTEYRIVGNMVLLPIKTKIRGPGTLAPADQKDIIDESLDLFRANCLFRNFEIKGNADRVLIYLILFISDCLGRLTKSPSQKEAVKILSTRALDPFALPGEPNFPLNALYAAPAHRGDADLLRQYLSQLRQELALRLYVVVASGSEFDDNRGGIVDKH
ncbi:12581_t:CDS:2 [Ambispora gerdemannii]|uniref:Actin-related protein 2/3 complex subunit 3 n=1 Tax=Ambispora gerdemannii TaxID=144530 RepID=A0A9N8WI52_9GLOM|nr:12581_t:CDS:2 [Ambispora gerdemannii]